MILLFTDFGYDGPYVGQLRTVLASEAPGVHVVDLMHDAPAHDPKAGAYLLAALVERMPADCICLAVVDPGVGGDRPPVILELDGRRFVGPGNGLFEIAQRRAEAVRAWQIDWRPPSLAATFHGRDLFAPVAAALARGELPPASPLPDRWRRAADRPGADWPDDLAAAIYVDRFGNVMTGLRAASLSRGAGIALGGITAARADKFCDVPPGRAFWYENSLGLVELAVNRGRAADLPGLAVGTSIDVAD